MRRLNALAVYLIFFHEVRTSKGVEAAAVTRGVGESVQVVSSVTDLVAVSHRLQLTRDDRVSGIIAPPRCQLRHAPAIHAVRDRLANGYVTVEWTPIIEDARPIVKRWYF